MPVAIETKGLAKVYRSGILRRRNTALRGVDLEVPSGAAFGLIGLNGAGKTTFIKSLLSVVRPDAGTVTVLGGDPNDPKVRARIGYLPERLHLPAALTASEFLVSVGRIKGLGAPAAEAQRQLGRVGLAGDARRKAGGFSKGMRQRLGLAAALLGDPDLLVLDEPTDGVDPLGRLEIRRLLQEACARGATVFLNSHLLAETERLCDRVGILHDGRLVREGPLHELGGTGGYRLRFEGTVPDAALEGTGLVRDEGPWWKLEESDTDALDAAVGKARAAGARLVELAPRTVDLETLLEQEVRG